MNHVQKKLLANAVRNLREFGYPDCDEKNILTDPIYSAFFKSMLEDNIGQGFDMDIKVLLAAIKE